jgi:hypothetical protein
MLLIESGGVFEEKDFGNFEYAKINGTKWEDLDNDGVKEGGEPGIDGVTIFLDLNGNGVLDDDEDSTVTDSNGDYEFTEVAPGTYVVIEQLPEDYVQSYPFLETGNATYTFTVVSGDIYEEIDFGNVEGADIHGTKFEDLDGDGVRDPNEPGLPNWSIYLDVNNNGVLDSDEPATVTLFDDPDTEDDESGRYSLTDIMPGTYALTELLQVGWLNTRPSTLHSVEFEFGGTITEVISLYDDVEYPWDCGIEVGDEWSIHYTFDPWAVDEDGGSGTHGEYLAITSYTLTIGCVSESRIIAANTTSIHVYDNESPGIDAYNVSIPLEAESYEVMIYLEDPTQTAFDSEDLPLNGEIDLLDFPIYEFSLHNLSYSNQILGTVDFHHSRRVNAHYVNLISGANLTLDFGNVEAGEIHGLKWEDLDGDGEPDTTNADLPVPSVTFLYPENGATLGSDDVELTFVTSDFIVGGNGSQHLHFRLDGSLDELIFYNDPDNVVELNHIPGTTSIATWIGPRTIRFNDLSDGEHVVEVWLVDAYDNAYTTYQGRRLHPLHCELLSIRSSISDHHLS